MVRLTESAVRKVRALIAAEAPGAGGARPNALRVGVRGGGCSGYSYFMELAGEAAANDLVFESHGLPVYVDPKSHPVLDGTELDFVEGLQNHGFRWVNPNERSNCGCGLSFDI